MRFHFTEAQQAWHEEVMDFLSDQMTSALKKEMRASEAGDIGPLEAAFEQEIIRKGWNKVALPHSLGGMDKTQIEKYIFSRAINAAQAPYYTSSITSMVIEAIDRFGTSDNKATILPKILNGEMTFGLGYSEPNAGTDLASLTTTATRQGEHWYINGVKTWNTVGHRVTHQWLLARTGDRKQRHETLSMFVVPMNAPGVSIRPIHTWGEHTVNEIVFDNVQIPTGHLIGALNNGWEIVNFALDLERATIGDTSITEKILEQAWHYALNTDEIDNPFVASALVQAEMDVEMCKLLGFEAMNMLEQGQDISAQAAMVKAYGSELRAQVASFSLSLQGEQSILHANDSAALYEGLAEQQYRIAPFYRFGGGANEVQRSIVAQRGLRLKRR